MAYIKDGKYYSDDYKDACDREGCFMAQHPKPKKILLECGCHPEAAIFDVDGWRERQMEGFVLDRVLVDTTCLRRPQVKIDFSSLVVFEAEGRGPCGKEIEVELLFELVRICDGHRETVQTWEYKKEFMVKTEWLSMEISEPFTVTFCDKTCPGCCEYKMVVKSKDLEGDFNVLRVVKPNLCALAQGICDD